MEFLRCCCSLFRLLQISPKKRTKASLFNRVFNWAISKFFVFLCLLTSSLMKTKVHLDTKLTGHRIPAVCWSLPFKFFEQSSDKNVSGIIFQWLLKLQRPTHEWRYNGQGHRARNPGTECTWSSEITPTVSHNNTFSLALGSKNVSILQVYRSNQMYSGAPLMGHGRSVVLKGWSNKVAVIMRW